eukprot:1798103-Pleurochrysis_carterae.AAC.2
MSSVRGVFQEIFGTRITSGAKKGCRSLDENVCLLDVFAIADRGRPTVGHVGLEETADGEGGAWRRGQDSGVGSGGASFEQSGVD